MQGIKYDDYAEDGMGYIYAIIHPVTKEIRYIGQTRKSMKYRLATHINSSLHPNSNEIKTPIGKWIKKLASGGTKPEIIKLDYVTLDKLNESEIEYIKIGRTKYRLLNVADGGVVQGRKVGSKQSKAFCKRQSKERSGIKNINYVDLSGRKFNKLTVIWLHKFANHSAWWLCKCECDNLRIVKTQKLPRTKSCGCARQTRWTLEARQKLRGYNKTRKIDSITKRFISA